MKTSRFLAAGLLALTFACLASAQTTIRVTGSSAFRKAFYVALTNSLTSPQAAYVGANLAGANTAVITGTVTTGPSAGQSVIVQCKFAGSVGGVNTVANNLYVTGAAPSSNIAASGTTTAWLSSTSNTLSAVTVTGAGATLSVSGGTAAGSPVYNAANTADIAMSDSFQGSTLFTSPLLTDNVVGVVPFVFVKGRSADSAVSTAAGADNTSGITNITALAARALMTNGWVPMSMLTGIAADSQYDVVFTGRDNDSGTRLVTFAEPGFGIFSPPLQYQLDNNGTNITGLTAFSSSGGYVSGGNLTAPLNLPVSGSATNSIHSGVKFIPLGYAGTNDAASVNSGNNSLKYNGAAYSATAVQEGQYTFWGYEHLLYKSTYSGVGKNLASNIVTRFLSGDALASGLKFDESDVAGTMRVTRSEEGGVAASLIR